MLIALLPQLLQYPTIIFDDEYHQQRVEPQKRWKRHIATAQPAIMPSAFCLAVFWLVHRYLSRYAILLIS